MSIIQTLTINGHQASTELCHLGEKTDKSPYCIWQHYHRHCYTPIYSLLFGSGRSKQNPCKVFCEIGVAGGESIAMWRKYYDETATFIVGMDSCMGFLDALQKRELSNVLGVHVDVTNRNYLIEQIGSIDRKFDIVLDDSDHNMDSQKNILEAFLPYMSPGGRIIIEDVERRMTAAIYESFLGAELLSQFESVFYINVEHDNRFSGDYNNDALLIFTVKN